MPNARKRGKDKSRSQRIFLAYYQLNPVTPYPSLLRPPTVADCSLTGTQVGALATMGSYSVQYDKPGTYYYKCGGKQSG